MELKKISIIKNYGPFISQQKTDELPFPKYKKAVYEWQNTYLGITSIIIIRKKISYGG